MADQTWLANLQAVPRNPHQRPEQSEPSK